MCTGNRGISKSLTMMPTNRYSTLQNRLPDLNHSLTQHLPPQSLLSFFSLTLSVSASAQPILISFPFCQTCHHLSEHPSSPLPAPVTLSPNNRLCYDAHGYVSRGPFAHTSIQQLCEAWCADTGQQPGIYLCR